MINTGLVKISLHSSSQGLETSKVKESSTLMLELGVSPTLHHLAILDEGDCVEAFDGVKSVSHHDGGSAHHDSVQGFLD